MLFNGFGENFPYTNFHDMNLDWILKVLKELESKIDKAAMHSIVIADPIQWDITKQYESLTVVMDDGNAYLSMQAVPYGVSIENEEYWQKIFDIGQIFDSLKEAIAFEDDGNSPVSSKNRSTGDLVWLDEKLYQVITDITLGDTYSSDNVERISVEDLIDDLVTTINSLTSTVETLQNTTVSNRLWGKQIAIYGDSYSAAPRGELWQAVLDAMTGTTCHVSATGSLSLPQIYSQKWDSFEADIYIIQAGLNDVSLETTGNSFMNAITNFVNAIRAVNTNAEIYFMTPPVIPKDTMHNYLFPCEFYRQCMWHLAPLLKFNVIDGLKWTGLKYPDDVHPSDATTPLIGQYAFYSMLNFGDSFNTTDDYSKMGRNDTQLIFKMLSGLPYILLQSAVFSNIAFDGSTAIDISNLGTGLNQIRETGIIKSGSTYTPCLFILMGEGTAQSPNTLIGAFSGVSSGSMTTSNGIQIPFLPRYWQEA